MILCRGYFCLNGVRSPCPAGRYGNIRGLTTSDCSGLCPPGHYCLEGSSIPTQFRCPRGRYGKSDNIISKIANIYPTIFQLGSSYGLTKDVCSGYCSPGYHCNEASTSDKNSQCAVLRQEEISFDAWREIVDNSLIPGEKELVYLNDFEAHVDKFELAYQGFVSFVMNEPNSVYCPKGSGIPLLVLPGYYTIGFNKTTRHDQRKCPAGTYCDKGVRYDCPGGTYGAFERLRTPECSGKCSKGFYCPPGSTSSRQYPCPIGKFWLL